MTCDVSTVRYLQSVLNTQTLEFEAILDQQIQSSNDHLAADYE
jgi:hypothetical protein